MRFIRTYCRLKGTAKLGPLFTHLDRTLLQCEVDEPEVFVLLEREALPTDSQVQIGSSLRVDVQLKKNVDSGQYEHDELFAEDQKK